MKKHPKTAFGIQEDGKTIKLVTLYREVNQVYLTDVSRLDLDSPLYRAAEEFTQIENPRSRESMSEAGAGAGAVNEFDPDFSSGVHDNPWNRMCNSVKIDKGVIAVNANEDQIVRSSIIPQTKKELKNFVRSHISSRQYKAGEWQTSRLSFGGIQQIWLHTGLNQLIEKLKFYSKTAKKRLYYQLADANDIALADYFRIYHLTDDQRVSLVYLGMDYRKAFLFDKGDLVDVYPLNIRQDLPEPEVIASRLSLAMDNVQQSETDITLLCGELASVAVVEYFNLSGSGNTALLTYPNLIVEKAKSEILDSAYMAQYALPIALAYKALFPEETRFTQSNFLPKYLVEAQKTLKFAWHGFAVLFAIFCVTLGGTILYLHGHKQYDNASKTKRRLDHELTILREDTKEITRMRAEIQKFDQNLVVMRTVLLGKNPWSEVLDTLNHLFQSKPTSWLTNMKKENTQLHISGVTTNRSYVIDFAEALPNSRILKVTNGEIHDATIWNFEITSDFPTVDWVGQIEAEMTKLLELNRIDEERTALKGDTLPETVEETPETPIAETPEVTNEEIVKVPELTVSSDYSKKLPPISTKNQPRISTSQMNAPQEEIEDYNAFIDAVNSSGKEEYTRLGSAYLNNFPEGKLIPHLRWHLAYKLYRAGDYTNAIEYLDPLVHKVDEVYPHALLLAARIDYARHKQRSYWLYKVLQSEYPKHSVQAQVVIDVTILDKGGDQ